jgi:hypothetical protein
MLSVANALKIGAAVATFSAVAFLVALRALPGILSFLVLVGVTFVFVDPFNAQHALPLWVLYSFAYVVDLPFSGDRALSDSDSLTLFFFFCAGTS